jgi:hypothetical protein
MLNEQKMTNISSRQQTKIWFSEKAIDLSAYRFETMVTWA